MAAFVRSAALGIGLLAAATCGAAEKKPAVVPDAAIGTLAASLEAIARDPALTTAQKAVVTGEALDKFNQQYKGNLLTLRLKVQDVVPTAQGQYLSANRPSLDVLQVYSLKFQTSLSGAEVMAVTKESLLTVTGAVSATNQMTARGGLSEIVKPGGNVALSLRGNPACRICLGNVSYQLDDPAKTKPDPLAKIKPEPLAKTAPSARDALLDKLAGERPAVKGKTEQPRSVDEVKSFFLKGFVQPQGSSRTGVGGGFGKSASGASSGYGAATGAGHTSARLKHSHVFTSAEIVQKFGNPTTRTSATNTETWTYKCQDGTVRIQFTQLGYVAGASTSKAGTVRLEVKSVDSTSGTAPGVR